MKLRCIVAIGAMTAVVGCGGPPKASPTALPSAEKQPVNLQQQPAQKTDDMDAAGGMSDALARKTEAYTKEMTPLVQAHPANPAGAPASPNQVQWMNPGDFSLSLQDQSTPRQDRAEVKPVIDSTSSSDKKDGVAVAMVDQSSKQPTITHPASPVATDALADKLSRRVKDYPLDVSAQLEYQLLQFLMDEPTPQMDTISKLQPDDRELVTAVLDGMTNFRNALRADNNMMLSKKIKPLLDMAERLRSQADLTVSTLTLCTKVDGFGKYDPIDPARFPAGSPNQAIVYCEIANFSSNLNDQQMWETKLTWDMTLYTEQGMSVWSDKTDTLDDTARVRRHDFFVAKKITLPQTLPIGRYLLKVSVVDTQSNRVTEATTPLIIAAQ